MVPFLDKFGPVSLIAASKAATTLVRMAGGAKANATKLPLVADRTWPMPGAPADEFIATLLTFKTTSRLAGLRSAVPRAGRRRSANC